MFDLGFSHMVLGGLTFNYPTAFALAYGCDVEDIGVLGWDWFCVAGGSHVFIEGMLAKIRTKPTFSTRVVAVAPTNLSRPISVTFTNNKTSSVTQTRNYDYVISTMSLGVLRFVDLDKCNLSNIQRQGLRTLGYAPSVKIGLKFKTRWWENADVQGGFPIKGGQTKTDRVLRAVVYPSYGVNDKDADSVLIASYCWSQDALRLGSLMNGYKTSDEKLLVDLVLNELAILHQLNPDDLREQLIDYWSWDWYSNPYSIGAFASFGPSQYGETYAAWTQPAAGGRLFVAGEAISHVHGWVEGALESAYWAVHGMLDSAKLPDKVRELETRWGNPHVVKEEEAEIRQCMKDQVLYGTILSAEGDHSKVGETLKSAAATLASQ